MLDAVHLTITRYDGLFLFSVVVTHFMLSKDKKCGVTTKSVENMDKKWAEQ